ncbi:MAG: divergent polysaccharide deacetylase family protein, partial [Sphingomonadaceae bacterium]|nr:divergent polysaccharide deacetylase family protein [Sphingomonadaceae bacterium]
METAEEPRRVTALQALLLAALFAGLALLFVTLLRPLAAPGGRVAPAAALPAPAEPAAPDAAEVAPVDMTAVDAGAVDEASVVSVDTAPAESAALPSPPPAPSPFAPAFKGPRIAIVLTDVGDNPAQARAAIAALPPAVGLAFTPYPDVRALVRAAKADGHEVIAGLPMQPRAWPRVSPGTNTLLVGATAAENLRRFE